MKAFPASASCCCIRSRTPSCGDLFPKLQKYTFPADLGRRQPSRAFSAEPGQSPVIQDRRFGKVRIGFDASETQQRPDPMASMSSGSFASGFKNSNR
jgi:hypothetical protein